MKVDKRFHCFGCQADGDVIDFTSRLFSITPREAALRLAEDFGVQYASRTQVLPVRRNHEISEAEISRHRETYVCRELTDYRNLLIQWSQQYAPVSMDAESHPLFQEAIRNLPQVEYQLDVLLSGTDAEKRTVVSDCLREIRRKQEENDMEPIVDVPVYRESAAHARKFGELEQYRKSHFANIDCKRDIEQAAAEHFDGFRLDRKAIEGVMECYGAERVSLVLAATVQVKAWDERFSSANKDWAFSFDFPNPKRPVRYTFRLSEAEDAIIREKMRVSGVKNLSVLFRAMVLNGYLLKLDLPEIRELLRLMKNLTNNVNQMARRLNEHGSVYETEMDDILRRMDELWNIMNRILTRLEQKQNEGG